MQQQNKWQAELEDHKTKRLSAVGLRNCLKGKTNLPIQEQCELLMYRFGASKKELAQATELSISDIETILSGKQVYPYILVNWTRYLHGATDHEDGTFKLRR